MGCDERSIESAAWLRTPSRTYASNEEGRWAHAAHARLAGFDVWCSRRLWQWKQAVGRVGGGRGAMWCGFGVHQSIHSRPELILTPAHRSPTPAPKLRRRPGSGSKRGNRPQSRSKRGRVIEVPGRDAPSGLRSPQSRFRFDVTPHGLFPSNLVDRALPRSRPGHTHPWGLGQCICIHRSTADGDLGRFDGTDDVCACASPRRSVWRCAFFVGGARCHSSWLSRHMRPRWTVHGGQCRPHALVSIEAFSIRLFPITQTPHDPPTHVPRVSTSPKRPTHRVRRARPAGVDRVTGCCCPCPAARADYLDWPAAGSPRGG